MSPEQKAYWVPKAERFEIAGCYAQTEVGHGSNVRAIETTATFDPETDEIVMNSPTTSSHKYWIGSLGVVATHALVIARLILKGQDLGNHVFLVQVRNLDTHDLMLNVKIYEQGEKGMGTFASMDNGVVSLLPSSSCSPLSLGNSLPNLVSETFCLRLNPDHNANLPGTKDGIHELPYSEIKYAGRNGVIGPRWNIPCREEYEACIHFDGADPRIDV